MIKNILPKIGFSLAAIIIFCGCNMHKKEALSHSMERYMVALKRGDFDYAAQWIPLKDRQEFLKNSVNLKNYTISNVELERVDDSKESQADMFFLIELYSANESEVKIFKRKILWSYDDKSRTWQALAKGPLGASSTN